MENTSSVDLEGRPGVLGRADRFVETQARFLPLAKRLLGRTWLVEKLAQAIELARSVSRGLSFVTLSGELLEPDGTVGISQDIGIKIFGAYSRGNGQKSFALMARSKYGKSGFDYKVFPDLSYTNYKDLIIRDSAQDANLSRIRDILQIGLVQETSNIDSQDHRQSILICAS